MSYAMASMIIFVLLLAATGLLPLLIIIGRAVWSVVALVGGWLWSGLCAIGRRICSLFGRRKGRKSYKDFDVEAVYMEAARNRQKMHESQNVNDDWDSSIGM